MSKFTLDYLSFTINCYLQEVNGNSDCDPYYDTVGKHFNLSIRFTFNCVFKYFLHEMQTRTTKYLETPSECFLETPEN